MSQTKSKNHVQSAELPAWLLLLIGGLLVAIGAVAGIIIARQLVPSPEAAAPGVAFVQEDGFIGVEVIDPPRAMPDFTLTTHQNGSLSLSELRGQPTLMFYGFTHCPDICPLTLLEMQTIREALGDDGDLVNFVFISVDGQRDTPERLARYFELRQVDDFVIGLTGTESDVRRVGADYGVKFIYGEVDANGNYAVDHTASAFLLDADGYWIKKYAFGTEHELIVEDLQGLLAGQES